MKMPFLTASWENLIVINYKVDPAILKPYVPRGTELDLFQEQAFVSLIAFRFKNTKLLGILPSWPSDFEEINLRFYVKRQVGNEVRRAVVFIKELVPSKIVALIARAFYNEPYSAMECGHSVENFKNAVTRHAYYWKSNEQSYFVEADYQGNSQNLQPGSFEEFILEHYWGYTAWPSASTAEYQVAHQRWVYYPVNNYRIAISVPAFYGKTFESVLNDKPHSVLFVPGSSVRVSFGRKFKVPLPTTKPAGWVLYDGRCGFCSKWVPFWKNQFASKGFEIAKIQADWLKDIIQMHPDEFTGDIRLLLNDHTLINGADVYVYMLKQFRLTYLLGFLMGLPLVRQFVWWVYRKVNINRFLISKVCGL